MVHQFQPLSFWVVLPLPGVILRVVLVILDGIHGAHDPVLVDALYQVVVAHQVHLVGEGVVVAHEHEGGHVAVQRVVFAVEECLRDAVAGWWLKMKSLIPALLSRSETQRVLLPQVLKPNTFMPARRRPALRYPVAFVVAMVT